ncbi:class I SAM-dependent methyltransferase [Antarcticibacterium sp. 1MA-6-2]|uniref:class I SAM-dependent methyltransferase n=1 Tax=Antarcticibacterium sp. 1MA-6-2 TaxID=2908210 RepID=UPI001F47D677|nr:class I SAM-dependent methyltransferase [Antarcticibacterium sp. 1MA-6-2]UJH92130.1 class I SAM-dependent methyltransferase [Antarcticibacterium sp. 1MA-6-2]
MDFGCGTGPVASVFLRRQGFSINLYDPFFEDHPEVLKKKYDFIMCCEVMEHFQNPRREFKLLHKLLNPGGKLYCKTSLYREENDFGSWYYKNDPTHVFLYTEDTLKWIRLDFGFTELQIDPKLIIFTK